MLRSGRWPFPDDASPSAGRTIYWLVVALTVGLAISSVTGIGEMLLLVGIVAAQRPRIP
jgi:hypothetical protein